MTAKVSHGKYRSSFLGMTGQGSIRFQPTRSFSKDESVQITINAMVSKLVAGSNE
jgi:hypothetical protein